MKLPNDEIVHYKSDDGITVLIERTELVRCKDCKWWTILPHEQQFIKDKTFGRCSTWSDMAMTDIGMHKDYYCSYGERKEQEYE